MAADISTLLQALPDLRDRIQSVRQQLLANTVMFGEIPAPTFKEQLRVRFMQDRLIEAGCQNVSTDEVGNAVGVHPGSKSDACYILLGAHLDTPFAETVDHTIRVGTDFMEGPGILDNSLGLAVIATLPSILQQLGIQLESNLLLVGSSRSLGRGDIEGMRFFLKRNRLPIRGGLLVEGGTLGRLSYASLGMYRGVIRCSIPRHYDPQRPLSGAIPVINRIVTRIREIAIPQEPATDIILGSINGGNTYNTAAQNAQLHFEIRSEQLGMVGNIAEQIQEICEEVGTAEHYDVVYESVARRHNGGIPYRHPLVKAARAVYEALEVKPRPAPSTGELAALIEKDIPGITLGMTNGTDRHELTERIEIEPVFAGLALLITLLQAIDGGLCDVET